MSSPQETIVTGRQEIIGAIDSMSRELLMDPAFGATGKAEATVYALGELLTSYEHLVAAFSSSNRGYEMRDVPGAEKTAYDRAKHCVRTLGTLHGPQAAG